MKPFLRAAWIAPISVAVAVAVIGACVDRSDSGGVGGGGTDASTAESGIACLCAIPADRSWDGEAIASACRAEATSWCAALERCAPDQLTGEFGTPSYCLTRRALQCEARWAPGIGDSPERVQACAGEVATSSCDALFCQGLPASCMPVAGLHPEGAPCRVHAQCASGWCTTANGLGACGVCGAPPTQANAALGEDCSSGRTCAPGLLCNQGYDSDAGYDRCIPAPPVGLGKNCLSNPCEPGRVCTPSAAPALGQAPSAVCTDSGAPSCAAPAQQGLVGTCTGMYRARYCDHGFCATWGVSPGSWTSACMVPLADGAFCRLGYCHTWPYCQPYPSCESPAQCAPDSPDASTGHCKVVDLRTCP